ncbi:MAG TPA: hypothetical protein VII41_01025 [Steroidobacteraceae bacterium]
MATGRSVGRSALLPALLVAAQTQALEIGIQPRVSAGMQDYQLSFPDVITPTLSNNSARLREGFTIRDHLPYAGAGLTVSAGHLFADLSGQWSKTGEDKGLNFQGNQFDVLDGYNGVGGHAHYLDSRFGRQEVNAAIGWALSSNFSAYLGYKSATLNITQMRTPVFAPAPQDGDVLQIGSSLMDFSYHGFFLGTTYALPINSWGTVSVQASIAQLDASFRQHFEGLLFIYTAPAGMPAGVVLLDPSLENSAVHGSSTGLNVGISWSGNVGVASNPVRGLTYTIGLDQSQYRFQGSATDGDFEEKNTRFRIELRYRFGL